MIKLIVSDMDGTLLRHDKEIDNGIYDLIPRLKEKGIHFAVSSGRQYASLASYFEEYMEDVIIVSANGTFSAENGVELFSHLMDKKVVDKLIDDIRKIDGIVPIISGKAYDYTDNKQVYDIISKPPMNFKVKLVDDLHNVDDTLKVTTVIHGDNPPSYYRDEILRVISDDCYVVTSGESCLDIGTKGINKGTGLAHLQEKFNVSPEETMVFGDEQNDVEMFGQAYYSYAMEGASEDIKKQARFVAPSNSVNGVSTTIKEVLKDIL